VIWRAASFRVGGHADHAIDILVDERGRIAAILCRFWAVCCDAARAA
jgi:hypothetical protein